MIKLKGCPKCKGDIVLDSDTHGWYEQCLQCGYLHERPDVGREVYRMPEKERELVPVG
ncbi:MAG: hypothetical protein Q7R34_04695 [Dehalococcoidia bacterium]|nr:hypothetical protein [Dehalococcoidia bacterium]MDO8635532.1 hypothetical protein [Dehalococcoidia bacterium]